MGAAYFSSQYSGDAMGSHSAATGGIQRLEGASALRLYTVALLPSGEAPPHTRARHHFLGGPWMRPVWLGCLPIRAKARDHKVKLDRRQEADPLAKLTVEIDRADRRSKKSVPPNSQAYPLLPSPRNPLLPRDPLLLSTPNSPRDRLLFSTPKCL